MDTRIRSRGRYFYLVRDHKEIRDIAKTLLDYLPESLKFYLTILTQLRKQVLKFDYYVAYGWPRVPVCFHTPGDGSERGLYAFCPSNRCELIDLIVNEDLLVDHGAPLKLHYTHENIVNRLETFHHYRLYDAAVADLYILPKGLVMKTINDCDNYLSLRRETGVVMRPISLDDAAKVHESYQAKSLESLQLFKTLLQTLPSLGIYVEDKLVAWILQSHYGAMMAMYTVPEYRRRGYGAHLARNLIRATYARLGFVPYVIIRRDNEESMRLYTSLGFEKIHTVVRATLMKPSATRRRSF